MLQWSDDNDEEEEYEDEDDNGDDVGSDEDDHRKQMIRSQEDDHLNSILFSAKALALEESQKAEELARSLKLAQERAEQLELELDAKRAA